MTLQSTDSTTLDRLSTSALRGSLGLVLIASAAFGQARVGDPSVSLETVERQSESSSLLTLDRVPRLLVERAQQHLEDHRLDGLGWTTARLSSVVHPIFRPDLAGPAYIEFPVLPEGFIIVSTADHDVPIPHWSDEAQSIRSRLVQDAAKTGKRVAKIQKLDTLSYVAECSRGSLVARTGPLSGKALALLERTPRAGRTGVASDRDLIAAWDECKAHYLAAAQMGLETLAEEGRATWAFEQELQHEGMALEQGVTHLMALLPDTVSFMLTGPASDLVIAERFPTIAGASVLRLSVVGGVPLGTTLDFEVTTTQLGGKQSMHRFFLDGRGMSDPFPEEDPPAQYSSGWSSWTYYWAGNDTDQCTYGQLKAPDEGLKCYSGCGATAWALLIGWVDQAADAGNPRWVKNSGVYRTGGGYGSAKAVAPDSMYIYNPIKGTWSTHPGITSILMEIRGHIKTWCVVPGGSGATRPKHMDKVNKYFSGRTAASARTDYSSPGVFKSRLREKARDSIKNNGTPAIIGVGGLNFWNWHYPLAYAYKFRKKSTLSGTKYQREFKVNQGAGGGGLLVEWIKAKTWFCGEILPS
jgi:hypothetical protein